MSLAIYAACMLKDDHLDAVKIFSEKTLQATFRAAFNQSGHTALYMAAHYDHDLMATFLLSNGAEVDTTGEVCVVWGQGTYVVLDVCLCVEQLC